VAALLEPSRTAAGGILSAVQVRGLIEVFDISLHRSGGLVLVELEPAAIAARPSGAVLAMRNSLRRSVARIAGGQAGPNRQR
jgi:light-regulated signal transduction histidine kinase (bacteriophytochrome)